MACCKEGLSHFHLAVEKDFLLKAEGFAHNYMDLVPVVINVGYGRIHGREYKIFTQVTMVEQHLPTTQVQKLEYVYIYELAIYRYIHR